MKEFFDFLSSNSDYAAFIFGIALALLGIFAPKKFVGFVVDWTSATSGAAIVIGLLFVAFSFPQLRFWQSNTINVDRSVIAALTSNTQKAIDSINSARSGNSYPWCADKSGEGLAPLNTTLAALKKLAATK